MEGFQVILALAILGLSYGAHQEHKAALLGLNSEDRIPQEYIVLLKPGDSPLSMRLNAFQAYVARRRLLGVNVLGQAQMRDFVALLVSADESVIELLRSYEDVSVITTNTRVKINSEPSWISEVDSGQCVQQEPGTTPWGLTRTSFEDKPTDYNTATYSYNSKSGSGVTAYVLDTGIYIEHDDFEGRAVWGFTASNLTDEGDVDLNGHGTHVAGTIGGKRFGISKSARLVAVKTCNGQGSCPLFAEIQGIAWACNDFLQNRGRDKKFKAVINMSLGGPFNEGSIVENIAIQLCTDWGMIFVVAAGNNGTDACNYSPARMSSVITVGATDLNDTIAWFSNWGTCVNVLAPGVDIMSAGIDGSSSIKMMNGTSMASPHVAGVVARYLSGLQEQPSPATVKAWISDMALKNKVVLNLTADDYYLMSTPNLLLYIPCAKVVDSEDQDSAVLNDVLIVTSITLSFVCLLLIAAILVGAFWGYMQWKKAQRPDAYTANAQETSSSRNLPMA